MSPAAGTVPTAAERVRSACARARPLLAVDGVDPDPIPVPLCHLLDDGSLAIALPAGAVTAAISGTGEQAMLELTDHAPVRLRQRVRALVWIRGRLQQVPAARVGGLLDRIAADDPNPALLQVRSPRSDAVLPAGDDQYTLVRLTIESVVLADASGAESVPIDELLAARPDPLCAVEAGWLQHLDTKHPEVVGRLVAKLAPRHRRGRVRPLGVDRYGLWLRVESGDEDRDVRLGFDRSVEDLSALNRAVRVLMGCPFMNGLHARRS